MWARTSAKVSDKLVSIVTSVIVGTVGRSITGCVYEGAVVEKVTVFALGSGAVGAEALRVNVLIVGASGKTIVGLEYVGTSAVNDAVLVLRIGASGATAVTDKEPIAGVTGIVTVGLVYVGVSALKLTAVVPDTSITGLAGSVNVPTFPNVGATNTGFVYVGGVPVNETTGASFVGAIGAVASILKSDIVGAELNAITGAVYTGAVPKAVIVCSATPVALASVYESVGTAGAIGALAFIDRSDMVGASDSAITGAMYVGAVPKLEIVCSATPVAEASP